MKKEFWHFAFVASLLAAFSACGDGATDPKEDDFGGNAQSSSSSLINESVSSSSIVSESSSSSQSAANDSILKVPEGGLFRWVGSESGRVITGLDNGSGTSGYWYNFNDNFDGGASKVTFPVETDYMGNDDWAEPIVQKCQGMCETYELHKGTFDEKPLVGLGFNIAGVDEETYEAVAADASAWGGLCIAYSVDHTAMLKMGLGAKVEASLGYDIPFVTLPAAPEGTVKCFKWSMFNLGAGPSVDGEEFAKNLVSVKIVIQGDDGTTGKVNIMSIGSYVEM